MRCGGEAGVIEERGHRAGPKRGGAGGEGGATRKVLASGVAEELDRGGIGGAHSRRARAQEEALRLGWARLDGAMSVMLGRRQARLIG